jgi:hypothetical protein
MADALNRFRSIERCEAGLSETGRERRTPRRQFCGAMMMYLPYQSLSYVAVASSSR